MIDEDTARDLAEKAAKQLLGTLLSGSPSPVLMDRFVREDRFRIFYRRRDLEISPEDFRYCKAFAVGRDGDTLIVADYLDDEVRLRSHLLEMSDLFERLEASNARRAAAELVNPTA